MRLSVPDNAVPPPEEVARAVDAYLTDGRGDRVQMGVTAACLHLAVGTVASVLGQLMGPTGGLVAGGLGLVCGIAVGVHNAKHYMEGKERVMSAALGGTFTAMQGMISGFLAGSGSVTGALICTGIGAFVAGTMTGGLRGARSKKAIADFQAVDRHVDRTLTLERMALNNQNKQPAQATR